MMRVGPVVAAVLLVTVFAWSGWTAISEAAIPRQAEAVAYWGVDKPEATLIFDQAELEKWPVTVTGPDGQAQVLAPRGLALLNGHEMWVGDHYAASGPAERCLIELHEYGHLIGVGHVVDPRDPEGVMFGQTPMICLALEAPVTPAPHVDVGEAARLEEERRVDQENRESDLEFRSLRRSAEQRLRFKRRACIERAGERATRKQRVRVRRACWRAHREAARWAP